MKDQSLAELQALMREAISIASHAGSDIPVGAIIIVDGNKIAWSANRKEELRDPTAHAEILAIRQATRLSGDWRLEGAILISTLEPCAMCTEAIIQSRISKLVFGAYDSLSGACGSAFNLFAGTRIYPLPEVLGGIEEESCKKLLHDFFRTRRSN